MTLVITQKSQCSNLQTPSSTQIDRNTVTALLRFCSERKDWSINTWNRVYSQLSPLLSYSTLRISKTSVFGRSPGLMSLPLKSSNLLEQSWYGSDVISRTLKSPHNPTRTNCDVRLLCGSHIETVSDIKLAWNERFRDNPRMKIVTRKVPSNFSTRWSPDTYLLKKPGVLKNKVPCFVQKKYVETSELFSKPSCMQWSEQSFCLENQIVSARKEFSQETLEKVTAGMPGRVSKCLKLH